MKRSAFTMIELVFVIVVLGILAAIAVPKFSATREDAQIAKARSTIAAVRSAIVNERQARLFRGRSNFVNRLDSGVGAAQPASGMIFDTNGTVSLLMYGVKTDAGSGHWTKTAANEYTVKIANKSVAFDYNASNGIFDCDHAVELCKTLTE